jgi:hypothetical protein
MKTTYYRQCKLQKKNTFQTSYIPEEFAVMNKIIKLRDNNVWDDGWKVIAVSSSRHADDNLPDSHSSIKAHRRATGDSQRK